MSIASPTGSSDTGGGNSGYQEPDWNSIYSPLFNSLNDQAATAQADEAGIESELGRTKATNLEELANQKATQAAALDKQSQQIDQQKQSALQQARQIFQELSQYNLSRFGSGSSAGPAAMELLGRSTQQQFGNIETQANNGQTDVTTRRYDLDRFAQLNERKINDDYENKLYEAKAALRKQVDAINSARNSFESDKAAKRLEALQANNQYVQQLQQQKIANIIELEKWRLQQATYLESIGKTIPTSLTPEEFYSITTPMGQAVSNIVGQAAPKSLSYQMPSSVGGVTYLNSTKKPDDIWNLS